MITTEVFILKDEEDENVDFLKKLFNSSIFSFVVDVIVPKPIGIPESSVMSEEEIYKNYEYQWCFRNMKNKLNSVLILRSTSLTNANEETISRFINELNRCKDNFDLFYLCRWKDECQKITDIREIENIGIKIGRTYSPSGLQAVYFSPSGRNILLGILPMRNDKYFSMDIPLEAKLIQEIQSGNIISYCTIGNLFSYDLTKALSNEDYSRTQECINICKEENKNKTGNTAYYNYLWVVIILIIIIICVIAILSMKKY